MKPTNAELIVKLEAAVDGLLYPSESDFPFGTFVWEVAEQQEFRVGKLFNLISKDINYFLQHCKKEETWKSYSPYLVNPKQVTQELGQNYQDFIDFLRSYTTNLQLDQISFSAPNTHELGINECFIGNTLDGDWIGIARELDLGNAGASNDKFLLKTPTQLSKNTLKLLSELEIATKKLKYIGQSQYHTFPPSPVFIDPKYVWEVAATREDVLEKLLDTTEIVRTFEFDNFEDFGYEEEEKERFINLAQLLHSRLTNLRKYVFFSCYIYFVGDTQDGDVVGIWTQVTWT